MSRLKFEVYLVPFVGVKIWINGCVLSTVKLADELARLLTVSFA